MNPREKHSGLIKEYAKKLGFTDCGIAKADILNVDAKILKLWLKKNMHGEMQYMQKHFPKRIDPRKLVPQGKSVIVTLLNYYTEKSTPNTNSPKISKYSYGKDYHKVVKKKLKQLLDFIQHEVRNMSVQGRYFVDSAPILERTWAAKAGLGWIGKNSMLISPKFGSFVFLGILIVDVELEYDAPIKDFCGSCERCLNACPTQAIVNPKIVDANKCISYLTIENKKEIHSSFKGKLQNYIFGCDICQEVCPWNKKSKEHNIEEFQPQSHLLEMTKENWLNLSEEEFNNRFKDSALKRAGFRNLIRNLEFLE